MVEFIEITSQTTRINYEKKDITDYKVSGNAAYDKDNALTEANGTIVRDLDKKNIGSFNIYGSAEDMRINLSCSAAMSDIVNDIAKATMADLVGGYPKK